VPQPVLAQLSSKLCVNKDNEPLISMPLLLAVTHLMLIWVIT
jgi:hypothetical protein